MRRAALGVVALVSLAGDADSECARIPMLPHVLTKADAAVSPTGGGVVVGLGYGKQDDREVRTVEGKGWRFKHGTKLEAPVVKTIAPGLAVYEIPPADQATLVDDTGRERVTIRRLPRQAMGLEQPRLHGATATSNRLVIVLDGAVPYKTTGIIVYQGSTAVNWTIVGPTARSIEITGGGRCANDIPGSSVPTSGEITVAWFDGTGRVSIPSKPITIKPAKN